MKPKSIQLSRRSSIKLKLKQKKCSTPRCIHYAASARSKFCRECFVKNAASANMKRKVYGGNVNAKGTPGNRGNVNGKGTPGNRGNVNAKGTPGNRGGKGTPGNHGNETIGRTKKAAGKRSALRRCTKMVLLMKARWLDLILSGKKTWEIRGTQTTQRGIIHLALSGAGGQIAGQCRITKSYTINRKTLSKHFTKHRIEDLSIVTYRKPHVWEISHVRRYKQPFLFGHPQGAVIWVRL